jgi:hypothetical protein
MRSGRPSSFWFPQTIKPSILIVRTNNQLSGGDDEYSEPYYLRLKSTTEAFKADWKNSIGIIGSQEVGGPLWICPIHSKIFESGICCFATSLKDTFRINTSAVGLGSLGIVAGAPWKIESSQFWEIGVEALSKMKFRLDFWNIKRGRRYLLETIVVHQIKGTTFRFYSTHLSHGDQKSQRKSQLEKIISIILARPQAGELPPIIVGDFNTTPDDKSEDSLRKFCNHFQLAHSWGVDLIWVGYRKSFPQCSGSLTLISKSVVDLKNPDITDHNAPSAGLAIKLW